MNIFDWFKNKFLGLPKWAKDILTAIWDLLKSILLQVGQDYLDRLKNKIVEASGLSLSNDDKFKMVFKYAKTLLPQMKDSALNLLIETLVSQLKKDDRI